MLRENEEGTKLSGIEAGVCWKTVAVDRSVFYIRECDHTQCSQFSHISVEPPL